jgi:threonine/homoserine/homoserine lactone efflux protein
MWYILLTSFIYALTGALPPGPLLTFTIYKSLNQKRGYLAGIYAVLGHATIEFVLIMVLLAGASLLLQNVVFLVIVGIIGGIILIIFGILVIRNALTTNFKDYFYIGEEQLKGFKGNSFLGGIIVSLSNPYWEIWWILFGLDLMLTLQISFANPIGILLFFIGHELGDLAWYLPISVFTYLGGKIMNYKVYKYILLLCGCFMIIFGLYFSVSIIIFPRVI